MNANLITAFCLSLGMFLFSSCKKDRQVDNTPSLNAAGLSSGKAGIRFTTSENFKSSMSFDVSNTANTSAITRPATGNANIRNVTLDVTEMKNNTPDRKVHIDIVVPNGANTTNGTIQVDLSVRSGAPPLAFISLESYSTFLGTVEWRVTTGTLTITRLTATEIEGSFMGTATVYGSSTLNGPLTISDGRFAGKF